MPLTKEQKRNRLRRMRIRTTVYERDNYICSYCGLDMKKSYLEWADKKRKRVGKDMPTVDHIIPRSLGGLYTVDNLATACWSCNNKKGSKIYEKQENNR